LYPTNKGSEEAALLLHSAAQTCTGTELPRLGTASCLGAEEQCWDQAKQSLCCRIRSAAGPRLSVRVAGWALQQGVGLQPSGCALCEMEGLALQLPMLIKAAQRT